MSKTKYNMKNVPLFLHFVADYMKSTQKGTYVAFVMQKLVKRRLHTRTSNLLTISQYSTNNQNRSTILKKEKACLHRITQCKMHVLLGRGWPMGNRQMIQPLEGRERWLRILHVRIAPISYLLPRSHWPHPHHGARVLIPPPAPLPLFSSTHTHTKPAG
jgi:hypothetical protein